MSHLQTNTIAGTGNMVVVVARADLEAISAIWDCPQGMRWYTDEELDRADEAMIRLRAALAGQQEQGGSA